MRRLLPVLAFLLLAAPDAARAAEARAEPPCIGHCSRFVISVVAAPGEANRIRVTRTGFSVEITDAGAPLTAGEGCTEAAPGIVRCEGTAGVAVETGDGDDTVEMAAFDVPGRLSGGPGDDVLVGGPVDDVLFGGGGHDRLFGAAGGDVLADGDVIGAPDADALDGGEGVDVVDYKYRTARVTVRLDGSGSAGAAGEAGEGDRLTRIDGAIGGSGDDVLHASDAGESVIVDVEEELVGGPGDDVLVGGRGDDGINAEQGADTVRGGGGRDYVLLDNRPRARPRPGARVDCGRGFDFVEGPARIDRLVRCEEVDLEECGDLAPASLARGGVRVSRSREITPVRVHVRVEGGRHTGATLARGVLRRRSSRLRLSALGRRLARRGARPGLQITCSNRYNRPAGFRFARW